jgi:hypothetical protein
LLIEIAGNFNDMSLFFGGYFVKIGMLNLN